METVPSDEDKLIINGEMFYSIRTYMRQKKTSAEIIEKIEELLKRGADINACDKNDNNNNILHIAVQKEKVDVVVYLLQKGEKLFSMEDQQRALKLALQNKSILGKEIAEILSRQGILASSITGKSLQRTKSEENYGNETAESKTCNIKYTYLKREGTSGVKGQLYETKLLSLVLHRALHDKQIEEFYLATNIKDIGGFDDVCFRYDNVTCFMQCKHRENIGKEKLTVCSIRSSKDKLFLGIYFDSYLKIRQLFSSDSNDPLFKGKFDEIKSHFVIYTSLKQDFTRKLEGNKQICSKLHDIIFTGKKAENKIKSDIFQFDFEDCDLDLLTEFIKYKDIKTLGKTFLKCIILNNVNGMMSSKLVKKYYPALIKTVISISKENTMSLKGKNDSNEQKSLNFSNNSYKVVGKFRDDFFSSQNDYLIMLKDVFCTEIIFTHSSKTKYTRNELREKIQDIANNTCAATIADLIGSPITFDNKNYQLILDITKLPKNMFKSHEIEDIMSDLQNIQITKAMIKDAVYLAGKKKLQTLTFQLPKYFDNTDLKVNVNKRLDRLNFLAEKFYKLIKYSAEKNKTEDIKIIDINNDVVGPGKTLEYSHLDLTGIGGAVGNLLDFDEESKLFTFNTKSELKENAKYVRDKIKELVDEDLSEYKFNVMTDGFPRISFDVYQYNRNIAREFLSKLWFYTNQAQEESVEAIIKSEISMEYNSDIQSNRFLFHVHSDAIFLRFHDKVQKWWKSPTDALYLTKNTTFYKEAKKDIVDRPILTVLTLMVMRNIKAFSIEFNKNAINNLNLNEFMIKNKNEAHNIASDAVLLTAAKIMQCEQYQKHCSFIHLDYIHILPQNDYETMIEELELLKDATIVIISEAPIKEGMQDTFVNILNALTKHHITLENHIIVITGEILQMKLANYNFISIKDNNVNLTDLTNQSQTFILNTYEVIYQGLRTKLNKIIDDTSKAYITTKLLLSLLKKEEIHIGHTIENHNYNKIKSCYIDRSLERNGEEHVINTLYDIHDKTVLISSKPGMGKTLLLTHLSLKTKHVDRRLWIVVIDMASCVKDLEKLQNITLGNVMTLLSKVAVKNLNETEKVTFVKINTEAVAINSEEIENVSFELKLFIHFYNQGHVIFLFDGFDKIYPRYTNETIALFATLREANKRVWITSDCYAIKNLTEIFGSPYELEPLTYTEEKGLLDRFWTVNVKLEKLNHEQYNNIRIYLDYVLNFFNLKLVVEDVSDRHKFAFLSNALHIVYLKLVDFFKDEVHSLSWIYIREKIKKKWHIHSYTVIDRYLQNVNKKDSLQLKGIPFIKYVAENYFILKKGDKLEIQLNHNVILHRSNAYMNALKLYKYFLITNIKEVCNTETEIKPDSSLLRDNFFNDHNKFLLYAIYKEIDVLKILSTSDINEIGKTINMIESGEIRADPIDTIVGTKRRVHLIFAEYFFLETLSDLLPHLNGNFSDFKLDSICDLIVNVILVISPPDLRNAFKYRLKYEPNPSGTTAIDNCNRITFELVLKDNKHNCALEVDDTLNTAINEGLINAINYLLNSVRQNLSEDATELVMRILEKVVGILEELGPTWSVLSELVFGGIEDLDVETIVDILNLFQVGNQMTDKIKEVIIEPVRMIKKKIVEISKNNKNLIKLVDELPHHLPELIRALYDIISEIDIS
ncbi:unnamed protein product [Arctia plantaginis]|uniref:NACHT domain-containing protein n=1 Tax=Arctia plantaginis TaxID=874455 RepID=A0A8S1A880_ARCPL|nr:unnamed protein product [Arctia plantaginis]